MGDSHQVAFQIDNASLKQIDELTPSVYSSRAEALRAAVHAWLAWRIEVATDEALARGYGVSPQSEQEATMADRSLEGLEAADLEW